MASNFNFSNNYPNNLQNNLNSLNNQTLSQMPQSQLFLQPQGNIYMLNNASEISNVPVGSGISAAISLTENILYLKSLQNGVPMIISYKLTPFENIQSQSQPQTQSLNNISNKENNQLDEKLLERIEKIEKFLLSQNKEGEKLQWQI